MIKKIISNLLGDSSESQTTVSNEMLEKDVAEFKQTIMDSYTNYEKIRTDLRPHERGRNDGKNLIPAINDTTDVFHNDLENYFSKLKVQLDAAGRRILSKLSDRLTEEHMNLENKSNINKYDHFSSKAYVVYEKTLANIKDKYEVFQDDNRQFYAFKDEHQLNGTPTKKFPLLIALLFSLLIICAEGLGNGYFLGNYLEGGDAQGIMIAFTFSSFNVLLCTYLGITLGRNINYREPNAPFYKQIAFYSWIALFFAFFIILLGHIGFAHMRLNVVTEQNITFFNRIDEDYFFWFKDDSSLYLLMFGMLCSFLAFTEGRTSFYDRYPYFDAKYKTKELSGKLFEEALEDSTDEIEKLCEEQEKEIRENFKNKKLIFEVITNCSDAYLDCANFINTENINLENILNKIAMEYRQSNLEHRQGVDGPPYFNHRIAFQVNPQIDFEELVHKEYISLEERLCSYEAEMNSLIESMHQTKKQIFEKIYSELRSLYGVSVSEVSESAEIPENGDYAKSNM